ncbi:MAG: hypothetical protein K2H43_06610, partial [Clostridia bacterium]|nr:hypothetical protein [Clostridia bacterium]
LYACWLRGYTCEELFGATVYYGDAADGAILVKDGGESAAEVVLNVLGEREFNVGTLHGRLNEDGTFILRAEEYGVYGIDGGGTLFLSGYGTAQYCKDGLTDAGIYALSMGNLLYFGGSQKAGTYRIGDDRKMLFYVDNSAVFGQYYDSDFTAFLLREQAVFGNERGVYVAHGDTISFYFGGEETQTQQFTVGHSFTYRNTVFYAVTGETVFTCERARLAFTPDGSYPVEARLEIEGEMFTGSLEKDASGDPGEFVFTTEGDRSFAQFRMRLRFGGGVGRMEMTSGERRSVWLAEGTVTDGFLRFTERFDYEGNTDSLRVDGSVVLQDGNILTVSETELDSELGFGTVRLPEFEIEKNGIIYRLYCDLTDTEGRNFRSGWYGTKRAQLVTADGSYRVVCEQFAGSENAEAYENAEFGAILSFALFADDTQLDAEYAFTTAEGVSLFHVFSGAYAGQYYLRFSREESGLLAGFVCDRYGIATCGDYVLALVGAEPVRMVSLEARAELPLLQQMPVTAAVFRLVYELQNGKTAEFAFDPAARKLTCAKTQILHCGEFAAEIFAETELGTVYTVRLSEGVNDLGEAVQNGGIWEIQRDYDRYEIVFFADNTEVEIRREKAVFFAESENGLAVTYTLCGAGEIEEVLSVSAGGSELVFDGVCVLDGGYYIRAHDEWDGRIYGCRLCFSSTQASLEAVSEYEIGIGEGKIAVLYSGNWFYLSPQLALYSRFSGGYRSFGGTVRRESGSVFVWEPLSRNGAAVTVTVSRSSNKLKPFTASAEGFPTTVHAENEYGDTVAEAVYTLSERGDLIVLAFTTETQDAAPAEQEVLSVGEGKWYFALLGYLLTVDGEETFLEACGEPVRVTDGALSAEVVRSGFELLPVRLFLSGEELAGGAFSERESGGFVWKRGGEVYTLIVTEGETELELQAFEGEQELFSVTFRYANGDLNRTVYAPRGEFLLPEPPAREGYFFVCWTSGYDEHSAGETYNLVRNATFTAQWERETR